MELTQHRWLFAIVLLVLLPASISASLKNHQCKRMDAATVLKKRDTSAAASCTGKLVSNHNLNRIPKVITEIVCPAESGNHCIQIVLPMKVLDVDSQSEKTIYVPSGCVDSHNVKKSKKPTKRSSKSNKNEKVKKSKTSSQHRPRDLQ